MKLIRLVQQKNQSEDIHLHLVSLTQASSAGKTSASTEALHRGWNDGPCRNRTGNRPVMSRLLYLIELKVLQAGANLPGENTAAIGVVCVYTPVSFR